eukprot:gene13405-13519_t
MTYRPPVNDILSTMIHTGGLGQAIASGLYGDLDLEFLRSILDEAGKFAGDKLAPLNRIGDKVGAKLGAAGVETAPGWREAYRQFIEGGWNSVAGAVAHGGMGLPELVNLACIEMWNSANLSFGLCPLLTIGAIHALEAHGSAALQAIYLEKLVAGTWTGTMNLTEPQSGSDLSTLRAKAEKAADGTYRIKGQKIYISYGDHDLTENIIHLVLARLPDAPAGTRGISLFLVPKFLVNEDGTLGARNDAFCSSLEHKLGLHASPTCTMVFGDHDGAVGYLVGEENRGLNCMFTMMNSARLGVGVQGVSVAERATQKALAFAQERKQGKALGRTEASAAIIHHADVQKMLLTMKSLTMAARAICHLTAANLDRAHLAKDTQALNRASLLTPIAKAFSTDIANEVASLGVQIHGGMGYVEETGAAQYLRDARILAIYEGTNGIQAIDLVQRKLPLESGTLVDQEIDRMRDIVCTIPENSEFGATTDLLGNAVESLAAATEFLKASPPDVTLAGATAYLRLFGLALGGTALAQIAVGTSGSAEESSRIALARFFAEHIATAASGLATSVLHGAGSVSTVALL